jgi:hypothetical protein
LALDGGEWSVSCLRQFTLGKDSINTDLEETEWEIMDQIQLAQCGDQWLALANVIMKLQIP